MKTASDNKEKAPKKKFVFAKRGPYLLVAIIALLVYVGIEITEGLGWLTPEEWLTDFMSLLGVFGLVIVSTIILSLVVLSLLRALRKPKEGIDWDSFSSEVNEEQDK